MTSLCPSKTMVELNLIWEDLIMDRNLWCNSKRMLHFHKLSSHNSVSMDCNSYNNNSNSNKHQNYHNYNNRNNRFKLNLNKLKLLMAKTS